MRKLVFVVTGCVMATAVVAAAVVVLLWRRDRPLPPPRFTDRANQVLAAWRQAAANDDFAYDHDGNRPRLLDAPLLRRPGVAPDNTAGIMVKVDVPMPRGTADPNWHLFEDQPPDGVVKLSGGTALRVPLISAMDAAKEISYYAREAEAINNYERDICHYPPNSCVTLAVTGARLDTTVLRSSRGPAVVPVWRFSTATMPDALAWVAVGIDSNPHPARRAAEQPGHPGRRHRQPHPARYCCLTRH